MSERIVLSQKAYILFYIKSPTNGHAVPAELAQHAQQLSKGLNSLQAATLKGQSPASGPSANGPSSSHCKQSAAPSPVFGPAQRPGTGLLAARQLHDELLMPHAEPPVMLKADSKQRAATPAAETSTRAASQPTGSTDQLPFSSMKGRAVSSNPSASQQAEAGVQAAADGDKHITQTAKRKADVLGTAKRPSMMQKMSAAGVGAAADAEPDAEQALKRKKLSAGQPAAAAKRETAVAQSSGGAVCSDGLANGMVHSIQAPVSAEHAALHAAAPHSARERHASHGAGAASRYAYK